MLPFLAKSKLPRVAPPQTEKIVGLSPDDELMHSCAEELINHYHNKNAKGFHQAFKALAQCIRQEKDSNAA